MECVIERCCGLDVHRDTVTACVRVPGPRGTREQHVETFGTTVAERLALRDWLEAFGVTHVAMESTGVYWKPVWRTSIRHGERADRGGPAPPGHHPRRQSADG